MSDFQSGSRNPGSSGPPVDPFGTLAAALRDSWAMGMTAVEKVLALGAEGVGPGNPGTFTGGAGKQGEMLSLIAQSYLVGVSSGFRYMSRLAQTYAAHQTGILSSLVGPEVGKQFSE